MNSQTPHCDSDVEVKMLCRAMPLSEGSLCNTHKLLDKESLLILLCVLLLMMPRFLFAGVCIVEIE